MTPLRIEFSRPVAGIAVAWALAASVCGGAWAVAGWKGWKAWEVEQQLVVRKASVQAAVRATAPQAQTSEAGEGAGRQTSARQAATLLERDVGPMLTSAEGMGEPMTELLQLSLDNRTQTYRMEYRLDSVQRAASVTHALNGDRVGSRWRLSEVAQDLGERTGRYRGVWVLRD